MLPNTNKVEIQLYYGELEPLVKWCQRNCVAEWAYEQLSPSGHETGDYNFYFESDQDLVAFTLWKK